MPFNELSEQMAKRQYLQKDENNIHDLLTRVATAIASNEKPQEKDTWFKKYLDLMAEQKFCPGGRVLAGAGTQHGNMLNCFVQDATEHKPGSFAGIMEIAKKLALVTKVGGGNGINLDSLSTQTTFEKKPIQGIACLNADHPDAMTFVQGLMRPSNQPDGEKVPTTLRNWKKCLLEVEGYTIPQELRDMAEQHGVTITSHENFDKAHNINITHGINRRVPDDLAGIMDAAAYILSLNDETHPTIDLSPMRPEGTPIAGSGGTSSGPYSFLAEIFDNFLEWGLRGAETSGPINTLRYIYAPVLRVVRQGGTRRGAGMATINARNPHVLDFITAKDLDRETNEGDISTFNISVMIDDEYWQAIQKKQKIHYRTLIIPEGKIDTSKAEHVLHWEENGGAQVQADWIFDQIAEHAWATGEPGLIFNSRVNSKSALEALAIERDKYTIRATNPCLHGDTAVITRDPDTNTIDIQKIASLAGHTLEVWDGKQWSATTFHKTGENMPLLRFEFAQGFLDLTPEHTCILEDGQRIKAKEVQEGQRLKVAFSEHQITQGLERHGHSKPSAPTPHAGNTKILSITPQDCADVYCCTVPGEHAFTLGNGILTGNCGEIPLTVGESCDLGAINLAAYVKPYQEGMLKGNDMGFDIETFKKDIPTAVRFLDNILDLNNYALKDNQEAGQSLRRLGLGIMGLGDMLILLGLPYSAPEGRNMVRNIMTVMHNSALEASEQLGEERGAYPVSLKYPKQITHKKRRNVAVLTVAPTGTTSMIFGVSSGIEPIFSPFIYRNIGGNYVAIIAPLFQEMLEKYPPHADYRKGEGWDWEKITAAISANHGSVIGLEFIPEDIRKVLLCAHDIDVESHVLMQATVQQCFDQEARIGNALSKTINLPNSASVQDVQQAYELAYTQGCKGITVYRDGSRSFQVLSSSSANKDEEFVKDVRQALEEKGIHGTDDSVILEHKELDKTQAIATLELQLLRKRLEKQQSTIDDLQWRLDNLVATQDIKEENQPRTERYSRSEQLSGITTMTKMTQMQDGKRISLLVTINRDSVTNLPIEVVINCGNSGQEEHADCEALGRTISRALQWGTPAAAIARTLQNIGGGLMGQVSSDSKRRIITSKAALVGILLEQSLKPQRPQTIPETTSTPTQTTVPSQTTDIPNAIGTCPSCDNHSLISEEGCIKCPLCGYSRCG